MKKKISAVISVTLVILLTFAACKKNGPIITDDDGHSYVCVTDDEGNTVLNSDGNIVVYETNAKGKTKKDENGKDKIVAVTFPSVIVEKGKVQTPDYILTVPGGWTSDEKGVLHKGEGVAIEINNFGAATGEQALSCQVEKANSVADALKKVGYDVTITNETVNIFDRDMVLITMSTVSEDAGKISYKIVYFEEDGNLYKVLYTTNNADEANFDIIDFMSKNITLK